MININKKSIVYVLCPAKRKTGGTELAHQLVYQLNVNQIKAQIAYYGIKDDNPTDLAYLCYVNDHCWESDIKDDENNVLIVPEINYDVLIKYKKIRKCIWWMSVDNYIKRSSVYGCYKVNGLMKAVKGVIKCELPIVEKKIENCTIHLYQSEYAKQFLLERGITNIHRLSDYINESYLEPLEEFHREDVILYNPKKGAKYTEMLIRQAPLLKWVPLINLTNEQVKKLLQTSEVYIDFGNHPGKDRFPREAAICGCCVITSKNGSAKYYEDVPIEEEYKFDATKKNVGNIIKKIEFILNNYAEEKKKFEDYKKKIYCEKSQFEEDVRDLFIPDWKNVE